MAYAGSRLEAIENTVKALFPNVDQKYGDSGQAFFERAVNACTREIAQAGYWRTPAAEMDSVSGQATYDLLDELTNFVQLLSVRWHDGKAIMQPADNWDHMERLQIQGSTTTAEPRYYFLEGNVLRVWPSPDESASPGFYIRHTHYPGDMSTATESTTATPAIPTAFDDIYTYYALYWLNMADRSAYGSEEQMAHYWTKYQATLELLLGQGQTQVSYVTPTR